MKLLFALCLLFVSINGFSQWPGSCFTIHELRQPSMPMALLPVDSSNGGYVVSGLPGSYEAGQSYTITISGNLSIKGLLAYGVTETPNWRTGRWIPASSKTAIVDYRNLSIPFDRRVGPCPGQKGNTIGHTSELSSLDNVTNLVIGDWKAHPTAQGPLVFTFLVVHDLGTWYQFSIPVGGTGSPPPVGLGVSPVPANFNTDDTDNAEKLSFSLLGLLFTAILFFFSRE